MMNFFRKALKKIKLFVLYWTRIVFVKNNFKVSFFNKIRMNVCGGFLADQYVLYDLKNRSRKEYLSEFDWYKSRYINEPFNFAFNNKVVCSKILESYIKIPEIYCIKKKYDVYDNEGNVRCMEDIFAFLKEKKCCFLKPFAMGKGKGVHLVCFCENEIFVDGISVNKEFLLNMLNTTENYLICEYMHQHDYVNDIYDKTVNTIRIIVFKDINTHLFKIFFAVQRIGTSKTIPVDNASKGALVSKIDLKTGRLGKARCLHDLNEYEIHPDSGERIEGVKIPNWDKVTKEILNVSKKLSYMEMIAWDILITKNGICAIEANTSSGINIIQLWGGQRDSEFGKFLKYHKVIK